MKVSIEGKELVIRIPMQTPPQPSKSGYANLSPDEQCACNWANMAKEQLTRSDVKPSAVIERYIKGNYTSPNITVGGASPAQQIRMDKAARRMAAKQRKTGIIY